MDAIPASRLASRTLMRSTRPQALRIASRRVPHPRPRFQTSDANSVKGSTGGGDGASNTGAIVGGIAGGSLVFLGGYAWYHFSGAKSFVNTAHQTKAYFEKAYKKTTEAAPEPNEAIKWLRGTAQSYAAVIPGAKGYVDSAFDDLDTIQQKHGQEVDKIVKDAYEELKDVSKSGVSVETVSKGWDVFQNAVKRIGELAGDAADDIMNNHPELKEKVGGNLDQLKNMGKQYGPEAQKQVDDVKKRIGDIIKGGLGVGSIEQIRQLVQDKSEEIKKFGDQAWSKGMEQVQPILEKQPELKKLVEENKDKLMSGNLSELWEKLKKASESSSTDDAKKFIQEQTQKATGGSGGGMDQWLKMIPGGSEIMPKLQQLQELSQKHGSEAEKLLKDAFADVKNVLDKKVDEGKKLADKAKKDAKK